MATTPREGYEKELARLSKLEDRGDVSSEDADAIRKLAAAFDAVDGTVSLPIQSDLYPARSRTQSKPKNPRTLGAWVERLSTLARGIELRDEDGEPTGERTPPVELTDADAADAVNEATTAAARNAMRGGKPGKSRVRGIDYAAAKFYRYHRNIGVDPLDIAIHFTDDDDVESDWTFEDILDARERHSLRTVALEHREYGRDLAVYHFGLYAGQRNTAIRTLRIKDFDRSSATFRLNLETTDGEGLKNVHEPRMPREINQAERAVFDWIEHGHPSGDPDHFVFCHSPDWSRCDPSKLPTREMLRSIMADLKQDTHDLAGEEGIIPVRKPVHPHMLRHNFVTAGLYHPDVSVDELKLQIGHGPESNVMETTYGHLDWRDRLRGMRGAFGRSGRAESVEVKYEHDVACGPCGAVIPPFKENCPRCGYGRSAIILPDESGVISVEDVEQLVEERVDEIFGDLRGILTGEKPINELIDDPADLEDLGLAIEDSDALEDPIGDHAR